MGPMVVTLVENVPVSDTSAVPQMTGMELPGITLKTNPQGLLYVTLRVSKVIHERIELWKFF